MGLDFRRRGRENEKKTDYWVILSWLQFNTSSKWSTGIRTRIFSTKKTIARRRQDIHHCHHVQVAAKYTQNKRPCDWGSPNRFPTNIFRYIHPRPTYLMRPRNWSSTFFSFILYVFLFDDARPETYPFHPTTCTPRLSQWPHIRELVLMDDI